MPKEIVNTLDFLSMSYFKSVENNSKYINEYTKISINKKSKNFTDLKDWYKSGNDITFKMFIENYNSTLDEIENWINKHSNTDAKLNL